MLLTLCWRTGVFLEFSSIFYRMRFEGYRFFALRCFIRAPERNFVYFGVGAARIFMKEKQYCFFVLLKFSHKKLLYNMAIQAEMLLCAEGCVQSSLAVAF